MKKFLLALVLGLALVFALTMVASADNGPHGGFTNTTDACASCHRIHSAVSSDGFLLVQKDVWALCTSCHDGTGAYTDVVNGYYNNTVPVGDPHGKGTSIGAPGTQGTVTQGTFAGGFINARMAHTWNGRFDYDTASTVPASEQTTSRHEVEGIDDAGIAGIAYGGTPAAWAIGNSQTVWGAGTVNAAFAPGGALSATGTELECTSCHDPHGSAGRVGGLSTGMPTSSYRLLRFNPNGSNGFEVTTGPGTSYFMQAVNAGKAQTGTGGGVYVADVTVKWYTPNTDESVDPTVVALRARTGSPYVGYINQIGDYVGRTYIYQRPAYQPSTGATKVTCSLPAASGMGNAGVNLACAAGAEGSIWSNVAPRGDMAYWCATCHDRYLSNSSSSTTATTPFNSSRTTDSGDAAYHYRHGTVSTACVDCHTAHGTTATMTTDLARNATYATASSILLKSDNRSICVQCHGTAVNFWNQSNVGLYGTLVSP